MALLETSRFPIAIGNIHQSILILELGRCYIDYEIKFTLEKITNPNFFSGLCSNNLHNLY